MTKIKTYIGLVTDNSASMRTIKDAARLDYNSKIDSIKSASNLENQDNIVSVVSCGYGTTSGIKRTIVNSSVNSLNHLDTYEANGFGTPLFDSVGDLIEQFEKIPDKDADNVSFLVMAITDGEENASKKWSSVSIAEKMRKLNATDRWTFVFRVPKGYKNSLKRLGIPEGNILEWEQTHEGTMIASKADNEAFTSYFAARSSGVTSTQRFYADLSNVSSQQVEATLEDISSKISIWPVGPKDDGAEIRPFVEARLKGKSMIKGSAFYQLEKKKGKNFEIVQDYKKILVRDKTTQAIYYGAAARKMLGLPTYGEIKLYPGQNSNFDCFIQSTSVNRKLKSGTSLIYWEEAALAYA